MCIIIYNYIYICTTAIYCTLYYFPAGMAPISTELPNCFVFLTLTIALWSPYHQPCPLPFRPASVAVAPDVKNSAPAMSVEHRNIYQQLFFAEKSAVLGADTGPRRAHRAALRIRNFF